MTHSSFELGLQDSFYLLPWTFQIQSISWGTSQQVTASLTIPVNLALMLKLFGSSKENHMASQSAHCHAGIVRPAVPMQVVASCLMSLQPVLAAEPSIPANTYALISGVVAMAGSLADNADRQASGQGGGEPWLWDLFHNLAPPMPGSRAPRSQHFPSPEQVNRGFRTVSSAHLITNRNCTVISPLGPLSGTFGDPLQICPIHASLHTAISTSQQ